MGLLQNSWDILWSLQSAGEIEYAPLQVVMIYIDTATFDEIKKDVKVTKDFFERKQSVFLIWYDYDFHTKVTMEAALGLVGGTMGLLTGFSILSGVEIVYYVIKFFMHHLRISRTEKASAGHKC